MASSPLSGAAEHTFGTLPRKQGMYNPAFEKDACGLAMVATLRGEAGHDIIDLALTALRNLEHRGAIPGGEDGSRPRSVHNPSTAHPPRSSTRIRGLSTLHRQ